MLCAAAGPSEFIDILRAWSERFAFLMLPISTLLLGLIFIADHRRVLFDRDVFSLHSLGVCLLVFT